MEIAIKHAEESLKSDDVPIGSVIVDKDHNIISFGFNTIELESNVTSHAEFNAIKKLNQKYCQDFDIYSTLQPCKMCLSIIELKRFNRIIFGAYRDPFLKLNKNVIGGILEEKCSELICDFFVQIRNDNILKRPV